MGFVAQWEDVCILGRYISEIMLYGMVEDLRKQGLGNLERNFRNTLKELWEVKIEMTD